MQSPAAVRSRTPTRHVGLWFEGGDLVLQAETTLFKVHRFILTRESEFFETMFQLPPDARSDVVSLGSGNQEGTESAPLQLHESPARSVEIILNVFYSRWCETPGSNFANLSEIEESDLVRTAHRWQFKNLFEVILADLKKRRTSLALFALALTCADDDWTISAFTCAVLDFSNSTTLDQLPSGARSKIELAWARIGTQRLQNAANLELANATSSQAGVQSLHGGFGYYSTSEPHPGKVCGHLRVLMMQVFATTERRAWVDVLKGSNAFRQHCSACTRLDRLSLEAYAGPEDREREIAREVWLAA